MVVANSAKTNGNGNWRGPMTKKPSAARRIDMLGTHLIFVGLHGVAVLTGCIGLVITIPLHLYVMSKHTRELSD